VQVPDHVPIARKDHRDDQQHRDCPCVVHHPTHFSELSYLLLLRS
jgi:hypothetical protein